MYNSIPIPINNSDYKTNKPYNNTIKRNPISFECKLDHNILGNEAKNIMSSFGGMENLAKGNMGDIFGNLFKNM